LFGLVQWSETPALGTSTTKAATDKDGLRPVFRVTIQADAYLDVGSGDLDAAPSLLLMVNDSHSHDVYVKPGDKARVRAAA
jgi:hypothetical protein